MNADGSTLTTGDRRQHKVSLPAAIAVLAVCASLLAAGIGVLLGTDSGPGQFYTYDLGAAISFAVLGTLILPREPDNAVGRLFVGIALASAAGIAGAGFSAYPPMLWLNQWAPVVSYGLLPLVLLLFPDGRLPSPRWRIAVCIAVVGLIAGAAAIAVAAWDVPGVLTNIHAKQTPLATRALLICQLTLLALLASMFASVAALIGRFRHAVGDTRQQLKWLAVGGAAIPVAVAMGALRVQYAGEIVAAIAIPATIGAAILKYRLYDIDLFLNRSLVYAILTVLVVGVYAVVVTALGSVLSEAAVWAPSIIATAVVALAFQPLRERVQRRANRLLYGDRDDPYAVLSRLGRRLEQTLDPATVLSGVVEAVAEALQLPYAAIELSGPRGDRLAISCGRGGVIEPEGFPMSYQGLVVGTLLVSPRSSTRPFIASERRLLTEVARQAGLAAHAVRLSADLQQSRDHLVRSREEERRRLRRDLHDGLGPALAGMTMQIGAARAHLGEEGGQVGIVLGRLEEQLQGCVGEIRRLIDDLRPPALDEVGLIEGIRSRLLAFNAAEGAAPAIGIHATDDLGELPAAVEVAAYRIAIEAVTNTVRHARASRCDVRITLSDALLVEVADDGIGLAQDYRPGVGLNSMRERAEELGGTLTAESLQGVGTCVRALLPVAPT